MMISQISELVTVGKWTSILLHYIPNPKRPTKILAFLGGVDFPVKQHSPECHKAAIEFESRVNIWLHLIEALEYF